MFLAWIKGYNFLISEANVVENVETKKIMWRLFQKKALQPFYYLICQFMNMKTLPRNTDNTD